MGGCYRFVLILQFNWKIVSSRDLERFLRTWQLKMPLLIIIVIVSIFFFDSTSCLLYLLKAHTTVKRYSLPWNFIFPDLTKQVTYYAKNLKKKFGVCRLSIGNPATKEKANRATNIRFNAPNWSGYHSVFCVNRPFSMGTRGTAEEEVGTSLRNFRCSRPTIRNFSAKRERAIAFMLRRIRNITGTLSIDRENSFFCVKRDTCSKTFFWTQMGQS